MIKAGRSSRLPKPQWLPPGAMSAPRWAPLTLAARGSQIFDAGRWWTIRHIGPCNTPKHPAPCTIFLLPGADDRVLLHWHLADEGWIRHPVEAS